jgi:hypothetical protein
MKAAFVKEIEVVDPVDSTLQTLTIFKHPNGAMFAIDSSFIDQCLDEDEKIIIPDPYSDNNGSIELI